MEPARSPSLKNDFSREDKGNRRLFFDELTPSAFISVLKNLMNISPVAQNRAGSHEDMCSFCRDAAIRSTFSIAMGKKLN